MTPHGKDSLKKKEGPFCFARGPVWFRSGGRTSVYLQLVSEVRDDMGPLVLLLPAVWGVLAEGARTPPAGVDHYTEYGIIFNWAFFKSLF